MKPTHYTGEANNYTFHYSFTDLRKFIEHGKEHGNNWIIIIKHIENISHYRGFGTIENPHKELMTFLQPDIKELGDEFVIEAIMNPTSFADWSRRVLVMDLNKYAEKNGHPEYYMEDEAPHIEKSINYSLGVKEGDKANPKDVMIDECPSIPDIPE